MSSSTRNDRHDEPSCSDDSDDEHVPTLEERLERLEGSLDFLHEFLASIGMQAVRLSDDNRAPRVSLAVELLGNAASDGHPKGEATLRPEAARPAPPPPPGVYYLMASSIHEPMSLDELGEYLLGELRQPTEPTVQCPCCTFDFYEDDVAGVLGHLRAAGEDAWRCDWRCDRERWGQLVNFETEDDHVGWGDSAVLRVHDDGTTTVVRPAGYICPECSPPAGLKGFHLPTCSQMNYPSNVVTPASAEINRRLEQLDRQLAEVVAVLAAAATERRSGPLATHPASSSDSSSLAADDASSIVVPSRPRPSADG